MVELESIWGGSDWIRGGTCATANLFWRYRVDPWWKWGRFGVVLTGSGVDRAAAPIFFGGCGVDVWRNCGRFEVGLTWSGVDLIGPTLDTVAATIFLGGF